MPLILTPDPSTARAQLVFAGERFVSLPRISEMLQRALECGGPVTVEDVGLTSVLLGAEDQAVYLDLAFENCETVLTMGMRLLEQTERRAAAPLARLVHYLAQNLPISFVIWSETGPRIPRDLFVSELQGSFPAADTADVEEITPRRVNPVVRRARDSDFEPRESGGRRVQRLYTSDLPSLRAGDVRLDAHVDAYEQHMREMFRTVQQEPAAAQKGSILASWAASLTGSGSRRRPA